VELRVFEGKTADETAAAMGCSPRTVHKYWSFAKRWLGSEFGDRLPLDRPVLAAENGH
jgi:DNA-directed RNA polymerase specialized sigma24 family protein